MSGLGPVSGYTTNFGFKLVDFDFIGWGSYEHSNWKVIDSVLFSISGISGIQGLWDNSISIIVGQRYIDGDEGTLWEAQVAHTTAAAPASFADDRAAYPTYWQQLSPLTPNYKGVWANDTAYSKNDFVSTTDNRYLVTNATHVSSSSPATIDDDIASWNTLVDLNSTVVAATNAQSAAETAQTGAEDAQAAAIEWAVNPEDTPVSVIAGGDGSTTFSALHWATKAKIQDVVDVTSSVTVTEADVGKLYRVTASTIQIAVVLPASPPVGWYVDVENTANSSVDDGLSINDGTTTLFEMYVPNQILRPTYTGSGWINNRPGTLLNVTDYLSSSTANLKPGTVRVKGWVRGAGGGGGGAEGSSTNQGSAGAGGGQGGRSIFDLAPASLTSITRTIGTGGNGGNGGNGSNGGNSSWSDGTTTITAYGGDGGSSSATTYIFPAAGGAGGAANTPGGAGQAGGGAQATGNGLNTRQSALGGAGGGNGGGVGTAVNANTGSGASSHAGNDAITNSGAGGGGAVSVNSTANIDGGNGGAGFIHEEQYG